VVTAYLERGRALCTHRLLDRGRLLYDGAPAQLSERVRGACSGAASPPQARQGPRRASRARRGARCGDSGCERAPGGEARQCGRISTPMLTSRWRRAGGRVQSSCWRRAQGKPAWPRGWRRGARGHAAGSRSAAAAADGVLVRAAGLTRRFGDSWPPIASASKCTPGKVTVCWDLTAPASRPRSHAVRAGIMPSSGAAHVAGVNLSRGGRAPPVNP